MNLALGLSSPHSARSSGSSRTDSRLGASWGPSGLQLWMQKTPDEAIPQGTMWGGGVLRSLWSAGLGEKTTYLLNRSHPTV